MVYTSLIYHSYLLRVWQERGLDAHNQPVWRFSLEDPATHQRQGFADMAALVDYLTAATESQATIEAASEPDTESTNHRPAPSAGSTTDVQKD